MFSVSNAVFSYGYFLKIISVGDFGSGKTSILNSYMGEELFSKTHIANFHFIEKILMFLH